MSENLYELIPKVDRILEDSKIIELMENVSRDIVVLIIREKLSDLRSQIKRKQISKEKLDLDGVINSIIKNVNSKFENNLKPVVNGTGVVIHTNLGRSLINKEVMNSVCEVAIKYSNLEFDLSSGKRGSRYDHLIEVIKDITGAEDALVVNNNAAAVVLILGAMAKEKEVITSRGELVEIGGSFRIPEVMEQSGAKLVEVGSTNKTSISDYLNNITEETGAFLKVHTSNYRVIGFTESVTLEELVSLGIKKDIPIIEDLGSGVLIDLSKYGLEYEPTVQESVKAGVDIISFSGDKLLGGPQAGIIIGKKKYIEKMKNHPLNRAFRIDKFTISALEGTLKLYLKENEAIEKIPTIKLLTQSLKDIEKRAIRLQDELFKLKINELEIEIVKEYSQVGGGSMPLERLETRSIKISSKNISMTKLERSLRDVKYPVIGRLYKECLYLDLRTIEESEINIVKEGINYCILKKFILN